MCVKALATWRVPNDCNYWMKVAKKLSAGSYQNGVKQIKNKIVNQKL
jgi:hypothetical protein